MTLTNDDLIAMLSNHCDKLTVLEGQLFEKSNRPVNSIIARRGLPRRTNCV